MRILFERERERERERPAEREDARREFDVPPSLTDTHISGDSSLAQSAFKKTAHRHFYFGMAHCFELRLSKMANYVIILWSMRKKIINYWYSQITGQTLFNMAILE